MDNDERIYELNRDIQDAEAALDENRVKQHKLNDTLEDMYDLKGESELLFNELIARHQGEGSLPDILEAAEEFRSDMYLAITSTEEELENAEKEKRMLEDRIDEYEHERMTLREE